MFQIGKHTGSPVCDSRLYQSVEACILVEFDCWLFMLGNGELQYPLHLGC